MASRGEQWRAVASTAADGGHVRVVGAGREGPVGVQPDGRGMRRGGRVAGGGGRRHAALAAGRHRAVGRAGADRAGVLLRQVPDTQDQAGDRGRLRAQEARAQLQEAAGQDQRQGHGRDGSEER